MKQLQGKRCLIVGGTSGVGLAAAARFLQEGARLVITGRDETKGEAAIASLKGNRDAHYVSVDAADPKQVDAAFRQALDRLGGLDVLYHVAGISGRKFGDGPLHECTDAGWQATLNTNLTGVLFTNRSAVRHFLSRRQPGVILNMASVLAWSPSPHYFDTAAYAAAKGGIISLSRLAAARYAPDKIRVNVIAPALIDTPMAARAAHDDAILQFLKTKQPLTGAPGSPEACAGAAAFLCSDAADWITGAVLPVDGGWCVSDGQWVDDQRT
jgi:NAD(P)-dependent dehydrogenase (short-subunit alcohol dehydrogenase family)